MTRTRLIPPLLIASLLAGGPVWAQSRDTVTLGTHVSLPGGQTRFTFRLRGTTLREALQLISDEANLNLILDDSVQGAISLDFFQTPLNQILETMLYSNGYRLQPYGKSFVVYRTDQYGQPVMRFVPLRFVSADAILPTLYDLLDLTPPNPLQGGNSASASVAASGSTSNFQVSGETVRDLFKLSIKTEPRTNRIVLNGPQDKVDQAEDLVRRLDVLTPSRVFPLNYITAKEAVDFLRATFFETGANAKAIASVQNSQVDFTAVSPTSPGLRPPLKKDIIEVSQATPRFVPLPTQNALLVLGTADELTLTEQVLKTIDKRRRQVLIKAQVVELNMDDARSLGLSYLAGSRQFSLDTSKKDGTFTFDTVQNGGLNLQVKLNALVTASRAKLLASPQILAMDSRTSIIKITDQIISALTTTTSQNANQTLITKNVTLGEAGITLELTPRIDSSDGISMNVHPTVSVAQQPITNTQTGDIIATPISAREYQAQEIFVQNGQTVVIGGLIQDRHTEDTTKLPLLGDLPFVGGLFKTANRGTKQTEVEILLTPELLQDNGVKAHA